jgi:DinB superfamily
VDLPPAGTCPICKLDAGAVPAAKVPCRLREAAARWAVLVAAWGATEDGSPLRHRPGPGQWSALEHACHVRDLFVLCDARTYRLLTESGPDLGADADSWSVLDVSDGCSGGDDSDPATVAEELAANGATYQETLSALSAAQWSRAGTLDGTPVDVVGFGRHALHEAVHHLLAAERLVRLPVAAG